jgi:hypothetical protein
MSDEIAGVRVIRYIADNGRRRPSRSAVEGELKPALAGRLLQSLQTLAGKETGPLGTGRFRASGEEVLL